MLSLVLLSFAANDHLRKLANEALDSYKADEIITIEDGGVFDKEIMDKSDTYVFNKENRGFTFAVNQGIKIARGDYIALVSNDTKLVSGDLKDLCVSGSSTSPKIDNQNIEGFAGSFFVLPRDVIDKVGLLDESMKIYYSDTEYIERLAKNNIPMQTVNSVVIHHHVCQSVSSTTVDYTQDQSNYANKLR